MKCKKNILCCHFVLPKREGDFNWILASSQRSFKPLHDNNNITNKKKKNPQNNKRVLHCSVLRDKFFPAFGLFDASVLTAATTTTIIMIIIITIIIKIIIITIITFRKTIRFFLLGTNKVFYSYKTKKRKGGSKGLFIKYG